MARHTDIRLRRSAVSGNQPGVSDLNLGELAINTADGKVYMKKSVGGTDTIVEVGAGGGIAASFTAYEYTATSSQTTFSGSDSYSNTLAYNTGTPPKVQVFMNGILLDEGSSADYTGTNGTSVVLTTAADAGDLIQIHAYKSDVSIVSNLLFNDNQKLQFGDSQDLQIYHDGSNSYINEVGTGDLIIKGGNDILFQDAVGNTLANMNQSNSVELYFGGSKKIETTAIGIDVTGSVVATTFSGTTATASGGTNTTALASTAFVQQELTTLIGGAPSTLNDLNELAAAINDDANYNSTLTTALATKLPLAGGTMTGPITMSQSGALHNQFTSTGASSKISIISADGEQAYINYSGATNEMSAGYDRTSSSFRFTNADNLERINSDIMYTYLQIQQIRLV